MRSPAGVIETNNTSSDNNSNNTNITYTRDHLYGPNLHWPQMR